MGIVMVVMMLALGVGVLSANGGMMDHMKGHMGGVGHSAEDKATGSGYAVESEEGGVTVKAIYNNPGMKTQPEFAVKLDTHSVDLDGYQFEEIARLRDDKGREYAAETISAAGEGHHREALLRFKDADLSDARSVELVVSGLAGVEKRVLRFDLQQKEKNPGGSKHQH